jgi:hypothetical protein
VQHLYLVVFTQKELIWIVDFRFGAHKVETTYIPSNRVQDFINEEEHHNDANYKFTCWQLWRNERRKLFYPCWDSYFEFSKFQMLNINLFWSLLFLESCTFLHNIRFHHSLSFFEMLSCMYNCNFGLEDKTNNLLALTEDMVLRKGKSKTRVTIKSNGGF